MSGARNNEAREHGDGEENSSEKVSNYSTFLFLIPSVIGLLQVAPLFESHPANMWIAVSALVIFCFSHATMKKIIQTNWATNSPIIDSFHFLSGALVVVSLSSIFLPHRIWWLFFVIWAFLAASIVASHFLNSRYTWIYERVKKAWEVVKKAWEVACTISIGFTERNRVQENHALPI